eukprot:XP_014785574.1 PREDICTED: uncharacterized protein LOC106880222 [Octopus bimaculoides]
MPFDSKGATIFHILKSFLSERSIPLIKKLSDLIKLFQENRKTLVDCKSFITHVILKMVLYKTNISKCQFPQLDFLKDELKDELDLTTYRMVEQFQDVIVLNIPNWYSNPFGVDAVDCEDDVHQELIELQNDNDATMRCRRNGKGGLW